MKQRFVCRKTSGAHRTSTLPEASDGFLPFSRFRPATLWSLRWRWPLGGAVLHVFLRLSGPLFGLADLPRRGGPSILETQERRKSESFNWLCFRATGGGQRSSQGRQRAFMSTPRGARSSLSASQALSRGTLSGWSPGLPEEPSAWARASANALTWLLKRLSCSTTPSRLARWLVAASPC